MLKDQVIIDNLKRHVYKLSHEIGNRDIANYENLEKARIYIHEQLESYGYKIRTESYIVNGKEVSNIIAVKEGSRFPDEIIAVGAHYDSFRNPGADDNASGVAGVLELARLFKNQVTDQTIKFMAFTNEEKPYFGTEDMGSAVYAKGARARHENIAAAIILDSIGYYSKIPSSQRYPPIFKLFYPQRANFITLVSDFDSGVLAKNVERYFRKHSDFPIALIIGLKSFYGIALGDHRSFWKVGYKAIMVTDTAFFRNITYHKMIDAWDTLDYKSMSRVIEGFYFVLTEISEGCLNVIKSAKELLNIDVKEAVENIEKYIHNAVEENKAKGVMIGLSGGLDSAVVAPLAVRALGKDNVHVYFLHAKQCEKDSEDKARLVADWLGLKLNVGSVEETMREKEEGASFFKWLSNLPPFMMPIMSSLYYMVVRETPYITTLRKDEFRKSRFKRWIYDSIIKGIETMFDDVCIERRIVLDKICKKENLLLIGAGNKSEDLTGWFTVGGVDDMPYSPIKSLYKIQVRQLAEYLEVPNAIRMRESVPDGLRGVTDKLALGMGYEKLDIGLYGIEHNMQNEEIMKYGLTKKDIEKVRRLNRLSSWKRVV